MNPSQSGWFQPYLLLAAATILCLIPFSGRAFHVDDTLFVWAAQNIAQHPLNPYGFSLTWEIHRQYMSDITQNPPLASYFAALLGKTFGWSERVLHLGFLLPAVALTLGTYRLALRFTHSAQVAAFATLLTPGFLVSACSVMCDVMMVALWLWAAVFWMEGLESAKPYLLIVSSMLIALCALTKYFGVCLIPLLFAYSIVKTRRVGTWAFCLLIPVLVLAGYQFWTLKLYGHGLLMGAAQYATHKRDFARDFWAVTLLFGIDFIGACALPGLLAGFFLLPRKHVWIGFTLAVMASVSLMIGAIDLEGHADEVFSRAARGNHWFLMTVELTLCLAGGFFVLSSVLLDCWENRNADSLFLALWVLGTLTFATFINWTLNTRSILPLVPAVGILLARRLEKITWPLGQHSAVTQEQPPSVSSVPSAIAPAAGSLSPAPMEGVFSRRSCCGRSVLTCVVIALLASGVISFWMAAADSELANSARTAANVIAEKKFHTPGNTVWFGGHWGFQYYMEKLGARPVDWDHSTFAPGDYVVIPHNNCWARGIYPQYVASVDRVAVPIRSWASTISWQLGAGFYDSFWGPMPFAIGPVPTESYTIVKLAPNVEGTPISDLRPNK